MSTSAPAGPVAKCGEAATWWAMSLSYLLGISPFVLFFDTGAGLETAPASAPVSAATRCVTRHSPSRTMKIMPCPGCPCLTTVVPRGAFACRMEAARRCSFAEGTSERPESPRSSDTLISMTRAISLDIAASNTRAGTVSNLAASRATTVCGRSASICTPISARSPNPWPAMRTALQGPYITDGSRAFSMACRTTSINPRFIGCASASAPVSVLVC
mmetsp:Transcript_49625/g.158511  ORF Transcript_49625/g.158511 Transcript_49625/m.158511 type:complete len:216 (-) Transcript_49625:822-1469(-)